MAASPSRSSRLRASTPNTIREKSSRVLKIESSTSAFGYSGSCRAFFDFQLSYIHFLEGALVSTVAVAAAVAGGVGLRGLDSKTIRFLELDESTHGWLRCV
ncbi:Uncharacterized protein Fot_22804 [Forsythia ovata]|uniref:Uncharacterized protein n=1 Tax=Forsythia ovata TaxID=205694 RepID=A0ABD1UYR7_9LAMI